MNNRSFIYNTLMRRGVAFSILAGVSYAGVVTANEWGSDLNLLDTIQKAPVTKCSGGPGHDHSEHAHSVNEDHSGHDHSSEEHKAHAADDDHSGHDHEDHTGHDHGSEAHKAHAADVDHSGHDHGEQVEDHTGHDHGSEEHESHEEDGSCSGHGHDEHSDAEYELQAFTPIEIKNMRIKLESVKLGTFLQTEQVSSTVANVAQNKRPLYAPWSGRVKKISTIAGAAVREGHELLTIVRDPIPRIELNLTGDILKPASEEYHALTASLRSSQQELKNVKEELARLTKYDSESEVSLVPQKEIRELKYAQANLKKSIENDLLKLQLHGHVAGDNSKRPQYAPVTDKLWIAALKANGIWNQKTQKLYEALPKSLQSNSWAVATIGELTASSLVSDGLVNWMAEDSKAGKHIVEIGGLIQQGYTIAALKELENLGVFEQVVVIKAPAGDTGWDINSVNIRVGQYVETGTDLLTISDNSKMYLIAEPIGSEIPLVINAMQQEFPIVAKPLSKNAGPEMKDLSIIKVGVRQNGTQEAIALSENEMVNVAHNDGQVFRSWGLRTGMKYIMHVPIAQLKNVYTIPVDAVIESGGQNFIFVKSHDNEFEKRHVVISYKDSDYAVLGKDSELKSGDSVVVEGAFAMNLAFLSETPAAIDPHAGHNH